LGPQGNRLDLRDMEIDAKRELAETTMGAM